LGLRCDRTKGTVGFGADCESEILGFGTLFTGPVGASAAKSSSRQLCAGEFRAPWPRAISEVTGCIGLSKARFARLFQEQTGLTPKLFCRLQRFQRSVRLLHSSASSIDLPDVALDLGDYDQPHFIHEFHEFSGLTPAAYLRARGQHANHVPLRTAG
jgi:methylphosphotriester-DNA--protein-cysteine methyltransferase